MKNLNFNEIYEYNLLKMMKFLTTTYSQTHAFFQKKYNLMIYISMNYLTSNITSFHQGLKVGRMKDQFGQLIQ